MVDTKGALVLQQRPDEFRSPNRVRPAPVLRPIQDRIAAHPPVNAFPLHIDHFDPVSSLLVTMRYRISKKQEIEVFGEPEVTEAFMRFARTTAHGEPDLPGTTVFDIAFAKVETTVGGGRR
ncbi:MAG: hypothetical protein HYV40_00975 [Candidatus Levybacteria bacterium]|nr:hypothetical protein [Candidatus Levybacteria bacterium]